VRPIMDLGLSRVKVGLRTVSFRLSVLFLLIVGMSPLLQARDRDRDGVPDELEVRLGTDPFNPDTDGDGLLDSWEIWGVPPKADRGAEEPLHLWGADPLTPDIFVEIDWMLSSSGRDVLGSRIISMCRTLREVFGRRGFNIHFDIGPEGEGAGGGFLADGTGGGTLLPYQPSFTTRPAGGADVLSSLYGLYHDDRFFRSTRRNVFYYAVIALREGAGSTVTGKADCFCDEAAASGGLRNPGVVSFVVYSGLLENDVALSAVFLHELGHALGLGHGGRRPDGALDPKEDKINYVSIMNPLYLKLLRSEELESFLADEARKEDLLGEVLDFSDGDRPPVREVALLEAEGLGPSFPLSVVEALGFKRLDAPLHPWNIDWNRNGRLDLFKYPADVNADGKVDEELWLDRNDWGYLRRNGFDGIGLYRGRVACCFEEPSVEAPPLERPVMSLEGSGGLPEVAVGAGFNVNLYSLTTEGFRLKRKATLPDPEAGTVTQIRLINVPGAEDEKIVLLRSQNAVFCWLPHKEQWLRLERSSGTEPLESFDLEAASAVRIGGFFGTSLVWPCGKSVLIVAGVEGPEHSSVLSFEDLPAPSLGRIFVPPDICDGRLRLFAVSGSHAVLLEASERGIRIAKRWDGFVPAAGGPWLFGSGDRWFFHDVSADGLSEWVVVNGNRVGCFFGGTAVLEEGWTGDLPWGSSEGTAQLRFGRFLGGPADDIAFVVYGIGELRLALLTMREGTPRLIPFGSQVIEKDLEHAGSGRGSILALPRGSRSELLLLGPQLSWTLRFQAADGRSWLERGICPLPLRSLELWPPEQYCAFAFPDKADTQGEERAGIVLLRTPRVALFEIENGTARVLWSLRWDSESQTFEPLLSGGTGGPLFLRGDANSDGVVDLSDAVSILLYLFGIEPQGLSCPDAADCDDDGEITIGDSIFLLNFLFAAGRKPPEPGPRRPGPDPTPDRLPDCVVPGHL